MLHRPTYVCVCKASGEGNNKQIRFLDAWKGETPQSSSFKVSTWKVVYVHDDAALIVELVHPLSVREMRMTVHLAGDFRIDVYGVRSIMRYY